MITPQQARQKQHESLLECLKEAERMESRIDAVIANAFAEGGKSATFSVQGIHTCVVAALKERYGKYWHVDEDFGDQRDPYHWLVFKPR